MAASSNVWFKKKKDIRFTKLLHSGLPWETEKRAGGQNPKGTFCQRGHRPSVMVHRKAVRRFLYEYKSEGKIGGSPCGGGGTGKQLLLCRNSFYPSLWETRKESRGTQRAGREKQRCRRRGERRRISTARGFASLRHRGTGQNLSCTMGTLASWGFEPQV